MRSINAAAAGRQGLPFNSPPLLRLLAGLAADEAGPPPAPAAAAGQALAGRLAQWLDWTDAIALSAALHGAGGTGPATAPAASALQLARDVMSRQRADATRAILADPALKLQAGDSADFSLLRRALHARQRALAAAAARLRGQLRQLLQAASPALAQLAALDAALEDALREQEAHLLGRVVQRLEQQFQLQRASAAPGWTAAWQALQQQALLAELALRLLPAQGLLDALEEAVADTPGTPS